MHVPWTYRTCSRTAWSPRRECLPCKALPSPGCLRRRHAALLEPRQAERSASHTCPHAAMARARRSLSPGCTRDSRRGDTGMRKPIGGAHRMAKLGKHLEAFGLATPGGEGVVTMVSLRATSSRRCSRPTRRGTTGLRRAVRLRCEAYATRGGRQWGERQAPGQSATRCQT